MRKFITLIFISFTVLTLTACDGETVPSDINLDSFDSSDLEEKITSLEEQLVLLSVPTLLSMPTNQVIQYGDTLDLLSLGVTATDIEDGDLTESISVNLESTDTLKLGNHLVEYTVTDSDNNTTTERINLEVQLYSDLFDYVILSDYTEIKITKYNIYESDDIVIPNTIGGLPVTIIGNYAFENIYEDEFDRTLIIPNTIKHIGNHAFAGLYLKEVIIPDSVTYIGESAFIYNRLTNIVIPEGVITLSDRAFVYNELKTITLPSTLKTIGDEVFLANELINVDIPEGVISIGESAFGRNRITSVTLPSTLETLGRRVFYENNLTTLTLPESLKELGDGVVLYNEKFENFILSEDNMNFKLIDDVLFSYDETIIYYAMLDESISEYIIPEGIQEIRTRAFAESNLSNITMPSTLITIGDQAFQNNNLTSATIPASVTSIGESAFSEHYLEAFIILGDSERFNDIWYEINLPSRFGPPFVIIPDTHFSYSVNDDGNGIIIEEYYDSESRNIKIPDSVDGLPVVAIADSAFQHAYLIKILLPDMLISIDTAAFYGNRFLDITIPASVIEIGDEAFGNNQFLTITILGDENRFNDVWHDIGFPGSLSPKYANQDGFTLDKTTGYIVNYNQAYGLDIVIPNSIDGIDVIGIYDYTFNGFVLESVVLPDTLISIGYKAFRYNNLTELIIPASVTSIASQVFQYNSFTSITILGDEDRFNDQWESIGFPTSLKPVGETIEE